MSNGRRSGIPIPRMPSRLEKLETSLHNTINIVLAMHALNVARGQYTHDELDKMVGIVSKVRPQLSEVFTVEDGIKAIVAAFRIETSGGESGK